MQDLLTDTIFLSGIPKKGKWTGIFIASGKSKKSMQFGQLCVILSLKAPVEFNSKIAGDFLADNIQDVFYGEEKERNLVLRLEKAILSTAKRLEYLLQREKLAAKEGIDLNITTLVVKELFVYMAILGEGGIMLYRDSALIDLTSGLKDLSGRDLIKSGSGKIKEGDHFVLLSPSALLEISEADIKKSIESFSFENVENKKAKALFGVALIRILSKEQKEGMEEVVEDEYGILEGVSLAKEETSEEKVDSKFDEPEPDARQEGTSDLEQEEPELREKEVKEKEFRKEESFGPEEEKEEDRLNGVKDLGSKVKDKLTDKATYRVLLSKLKEFTIKIFNAAKKYIWEGLMGMGKEGMYIRGAGPKRSIRGIIILILVVVTLLYWSIRAFKRHEVTSDKVGQVQDVLSAVDEAFGNGRSLGEAGEIAEAVKIIEGAMSQLEEVRGLGVMQVEINTKIDEGTAILDEIRRVIIVTEENIITDIAGYIEGGGANDMTLQDQKIYISDAGKSAIYEVGWDGGEVKKIAGPESALSSPDTIVFNSEGHLFINDLDNGLLKLYPEDGRVEELTGLSASTVGEVTEIDNYAVPDGEDFLYLLRASDADIRKILKYQSGYSSPNRRLPPPNAPPEPRFHEATDIEIDGRIYLIAGSNGVMRYYGDLLDPFTIVGLDKEITSSTCMELDYDLIYLGDSTLKRVVVITKGSKLAPQQGKFVAQFQYRGEGDYFADIREIYVVGSARVMFVLAGTKIFKVELAQIDQYAEKLLE